MTDLFVVPVSGGAGRRVAQVHGGFTGMSWTADGASLVYALDGDLWQAALAGGAPEKLLAGADAAMPVISRDGHRLAYGRSGVFNVNIWQVALEAPTRAGGPPVRLSHPAGLSGVRRSRPMAAGWRSSPTVGND